MKILAILCFITGFAMLAYVVTYDESEEEDQAIPQPIKETADRSEPLELSLPTSEKKADREEEPNKPVAVVAEEPLTPTTGNVASANESSKSFEELNYDEIVQAYSNAQSDEDFQEVFAQFNQLAESGDRKSLHRVATMLDLGKGVKRDSEKAFSLLKSSAEKGDAVAQYRIADHYERGRGVEENLDEAYLWYQKAADRKYPNAIAQMGRLITKGAMGEPDPILGYAYYKNAERKGSQWGSFFKAKAMQEGHGTQQNIDEALTLLEQLATDGFFEAKMWLYVSYLKGQGSYKDLDAAKYWLTQASTDKGPVFQALAAAYKYRDVITADDLRETLNYLDEPVGNDHKNGIVSLYNSKFKRAETSQKQDEALKWLKLAADLDHPVALLQYAYSRASQFEHSQNPQDYEEAISLLESNPDHQKARYALSLHQVNGIDLKSAIRQATDSNYVERQDYKAAISDPDQPDQPPRAIHAVQPIYPPHLKEERITGKAIVVMIVDEEGIPSRLSVENDTHEEFAEAALKAAKEWRFNPGLRNGTPTKTRIRLPFAFELRGPVIDPADPTKDN